MCATSDAHKPALSPLTLTALARAPRALVECSLMHSHEEVHASTTIACDALRCGHACLTPSNRGSELLVAASQRSARWRTRPALCRSRRPLRSPVPDVMQGLLVAARLCSTAHLSSKLSDASSSVRRSVAWRLPLGWRILKTMVRRMTEETIFALLTRTRAPYSLQRCSMRGAPTALLTKICTYTRKACQ